MDCRKGELQCCESEKRIGFSRYIEANAFKLLFACIKLINFLF